MRHLNDRCTPSFIELLKQLHDLFALARVQIAGRFVSQNQLGRWQSSARAIAYQLLLSARKLIGIQILLADHVEPVERVAHDALPLRFLNVAIRERDIQVLIHSQRIQQVITLEDKADVFLVDL